MRNASPISGYHSDFRVFPAMIATGHNMERPTTVKIRENFKSVVEAPRQAIAIAVIALLLASFAVIYTVVKTNGA